MERQKCIQGFTLIELLVVIAVASILFGVAIPSLAELVDRQRSWTALNDLRTSLHQARFHAAQNGMRVSVCRSSDQTTCMTGNRWNEGWIVFEDPANTRDCSVGVDGACDHGGRVLSVSPGNGSGIYITANNNVRDTVRFYPQGSALGSNGTFTACSNDGEILRGVVVAMSGRIRVAQDGDSTSC